MTEQNRGSMPAADDAASTAEPSTNGFYVGVPDVEWQTHASHLTLMGLPGEGPRYDALRQRIEVPNAD